MTEPKITKDVAVLLGRNEKGHLQIARIQGTDEAPVRAMIGELRPLEDGVPIMGEVVSLTPGNEPFMNVETVIEDPYKAERERGGTSGKSFSFPSQKFQDNWERTFGKKPSPSEMN